MTVFPILSDGTCSWCAEETYGLCPNWGFIGYSGSGGGMSEYITVDSGRVYAIPDSMSLEAAALVEPLAVSWHGVKLANVTPDTFALVVGAGTLFPLRTMRQALKQHPGPIGIAAVHCLVAQGVKGIIVSEPSPSRRESAVAAGAHHAFDPIREDVAAQVREISDGLGAHVVFECAGIQPAFDVALDSVRGKGIIVNIAVYEKPLTIKTPNKINRWSLTYIGSNTYTRQEFQDVIDAIASGELVSDHL